MRHESIFRIIALLCGKPRVDSQHRVNNADLLKDFVVSLDQAFEQAVIQILVRYLYQTTLAVRLFVTFGLQNVSVAFANLMRLGHTVIFTKQLLHWNSILFPKTAFDWLAAQLLCNIRLCGKYQFCGCIYNGWIINYTYLCIKVMLTTRIGICCETKGMYCETRLGIMAFRACVELIKQLASV